MNAERPSIDLGFEPTFEVALIDEVPASLYPERVFHFATQSQAPGSPGFLLRVTPRKAQRWVGSFIKGYDSPPAISVVLATPAHDELLVIAGGQGYVFDAEDPSVWKCVDVFPILHVVPAFELGLIVLCSFREVCAYGDKATVWRRHVGYETVSASLEGTTLTLTGEGRRGRRPHVAGTSVTKFDVRDGSDV